MRQGGRGGGGLISVCLHGPDAAIAIGWEGGNRRKLEKQKSRGQKLRRVRKGKTEGKKGGRKEENQGNKILVLIPAFLNSWGKTG